MKQADVARYKVGTGSKFKLSDFDAGDTGWYKDKDEAKAEVKNDIEEMSALQDKLYAQGAHSLLLVFQAMDAAGKDGMIKHVMSGINPQGCHVASFKKPSDEELGHDYLWRVQNHLPARGHIGIFNRSYYEEVLVLRVHPELLDCEKILPEEKNGKIWEKRFKQIRNFEDYLTHNGTVIRKFFLHISKDEQKKRFLDRIDDPDKNWKFSPSDIEERKYWDKYQEAYQDAIAATSTGESPWYVVPANHKWFSRMLVARVIVETMRGMNLKYPDVSPKQIALLKSARKSLE